ncbi:hypothetical protein PIB30_084358, partial [Stylosanthes scabra]|nr:hypothetical protein [Stylosanthes scabra]
FLVIRIASLRATASAVRGDEHWVPNANAVNSLPRLSLKAAAVVLLPEAKEKEALVLHLINSNRGGQ